MKCIRNRIISCVLICIIFLFTSCKISSDVSDTPEMLEEDEAIKLICQAAEIYNINIELNKKILYDVSTPHGNYNNGEFISTSTFDLVIDAYDEKTKVGFEYMSLPDMAISGTDLGRTTFENIEALQDSINQKDEKLYVKIFDTVEKKSKDKLIKQVNEFLNTLEKKGVIHKTFMDKQINIKMWVSVIIILFLLICILGILYKSNKLKYFKIKKKS